MAFVNGPEGKPRRLRGLCAKVVRPGSVRPGDEVRRRTPAGPRSRAPGSDGSHIARARTAWEHASMTDTATREFTSVGVIGLGTMGAGIAEVFARNGYAVIGVELNDAAVERGRQHLEHSTGRAVKREKMTRGAAADELLGRITLHHRDAGPGRGRPRGRGRRGVARGQEVDLPRCSTASSARDAVLATNTSSLSVTEISTANSRPGRVVGVHFFNPAPVQNLVEIIRTVVTEPDRPRRRAGRCCATSARTRSSAATRPASSPTRSSSATSTTRSRCTRASTPRARTSTPPCASAAATRWDRWRCST